MSKWIKTPEYNRDAQFKANIASSKGQLSKNTIFCFKYIDNEYDADNLCGSRTQNKFQKAFIKKIQKISQITIAEVRSDDKYGFGYELLDVDQLKKDIPNSITEDIGKVNVFRFGGDGRIVGYYNKSIFHILFVDPHLKLYDHGA